MCIILACEPNHRPDVRTIERCWMANPDGAGAMWSADGVVHISKGYMQLDEFLDLVDYIPRDAPCVMHMRIGTSGGYGPEVTHPYPITSDLNALHALDVDAPLGIAHNGILPYKGNDALGISDTVEYIQKVVAPLADTSKVKHQGGLAVSGAARKRLKASSKRSRLAILDADGDMRLTGAGWESVCRGVRASNDSWRPTYPRYTWIPCESEDWADDYDFDVDPWETWDARGELPIGCQLCDAYRDCREWGPTCYLPALTGGEYTETL